MMSKFTTGKMCRMKSGTQRCSSGVSAGPTATSSAARRASEQAQNVRGATAAAAAGDSSSLERGVDSRTGACVCVWL